MAKTHKRLSLTGLALDVPMAAFVAGAVGFVAFAMPDAMFTGLVVRSGLPDMVAAAQPPLGSTARMGVIGVAVFATFVLVWALLRALSGPPRRRAVAVADDLPKLRRADAHPDAPARRPIVAGAELGAPYSPDAQDTPDEEVETPLELHAPFEPDAEWEWEGPRFQAEPEAEPALDPIEAETLEATDDDSIGALSRRFEAGLVRRRQVRRGRDGEMPSPMPGFSPAIDPRLQSALDDLKTLANRPS